MRIGHIKKGMGIIGFDDAPFKFSDKHALVVGAIFKGGECLDKLVSTSVDVDGLNSTDKLISLMKSGRSMRHVRVIMLGGITFGGFNVVDINRLSKETKLPVIAFISHKPDKKSIYAALKKTDEWKRRKGLILKAGRINKVNVKNPSISGYVYYQSAGIGQKESEAIIRLSATRSLTPEPIRVAHIICSGLSHGKKGL